MDTQNVPVTGYCRLLLTVAVILLSLHVVLYLYHYQVSEVPWLILQLFDLDEENNIPTWFSSFLLLNNAFFLYLFSTRKSTPQRGHWRFLALCFLILALDEVAGLHESFNTAIVRNWAIYGGLLVGMVGVIFIPFLQSLGRQLATKFIIAGGLFVSGAIVTELLSEDMASDSLAYVMAVTVEEGLKMAGALMFLYVNLRERQERGDVTAQVALK